MLNLVLELVCRARLIWILGYGLAGHTILALDPPAEVYQLTPF